MKRILILIITALSLTSCVTTQTTQQPLTEQQQIEISKLYEEMLQQWQNVPTIGGRGELLIEYNNKIKMVKERK